MNERGNVLNFGRTITFVNQKFRKETRLLKIIKNEIHIILIVDYIANHVESRIALDIQLSKSLKV